MSFFDLLIDFGGYARPCFSSSFDPRAKDLVSTDNIVHSKLTSDFGCGLAVTQAVFIVWGLI